MKAFLFLSLITLLLTSCSSLDSVKKSPNCIVWKDQKYLGPYSVTVLTKKVEWKGSCKGYNRGCSELMISADEQNNVLSGADLLGKIENNELKFAEKHSLTEWLNFKMVKVDLEKKLVRTTFLSNDGEVDQNYFYNEKCSPEEAIVGGVAIGLIEKAQSRDIK